MSKVIKLLSKYSKIDILEAIAKFDLVGDDILQCALRYLQEKRLKELQALTDKASREAIEATREYCAWWKTCIEMYGDGKNVSISKIPQGVIDRGLQLEKNKKTKDKESANAHKRINDFMDNLYYGSGVDGE